jgi:hypothetical protein
VKEENLYDTPEGKQPYLDFWYNNTWAPRPYVQGLGGVGMEVEDG